MIHLFSSTIVLPGMRIKSLLLTFAAATLFVFPLATHAETNKTITTVDTPGSAGDIIVAGNYAYVADALAGITVLNVTIPSSPTVVRTVFTTDIPGHLDISGTTLYVSETSKMEIFSLTDPATPVSVGAYSQSGLVVNDVATDGTYAYILGSLNSQPILEVIDVTVPGTPVFKASVNVANARDVVLSSNYAYVVGNNTLQVINAYPILTVAGTYTNPSAASFEAVQVYGSSAYINDSVSGMHVINIANPASLTSTFESATQFPGVGYGYGLAISNGYAFLTKGYPNTSGGLIIYDVASSVTPIYIDTYSGSIAGGMTVANDIAYVAVASMGVQLLDVSHPDVVPPVVTPVGSTTPVVAPGGKYVDPGVTTDPGATTVVTGKVDTTTVGKYTLTYTVTDRVGNKTVVTRTVIVGPVVEKLNMNKNNTYTLKVGKRNVTLTPFYGYRGVVVGRRMIVDKKTNPYYVFIGTDAMRNPAVAMYNASGKLVTRYSLSLVSTKGLQLELVSNPATLSVYVAVAPKTNGLTATILNISKSGLKSLKTVTAAKGTGTIVMKWLKGYTNEYVLASLVRGRTGKPSVWRYSAAKKIFVRDFKFDLSRLSWTTTSVKLK